MRPSPTFLLLAGLLAIGSGTAATAKPPAAADAAVLVPVHTFLDALGRYDGTAMAAQVLPQGTATLMRDGKPVQMALGEFVAHVKPGKDRIAEEIDAPRVLVDGELAMVWAPYRFLVNGTVHHCGTDLFNLVKVDGRWKIAAIADNSREDCSAAAPASDR